ncbi:hypothetical protein GETHPA_22980 [Geothrix rubra]|uniref:DUF4382 domain-containing protein n=1 Tax=Geothrix rubra TaxID=2927977 RepID=A0ABQ5Q7K7_9BACT|nr:DUF4382 domain-containing protein [Geothrix rubra]GLH70765.1 hypothetical protein GETHPA_22980 [Geothrix rubra]
MRTWRGMITTAAGLGLALLVACGGSSSSSSTGAMNVHLVDGPISGYQQVNVNIQSVEIGSGSGWITLGTPNKTINLLNLTGGVSETLASGATLPAGHYSQMRLILGSGNSVMLADGTTQPLTVPSGMQTGIKLIVSFDVAAGTTADVWIDFDAAHSIQVVQAGASGQYLLRPTIRAFDKTVTGSIHGTLTDGATAAGLPGAMVYAETLDGSGHAAVVRSTVTDATGAYTLDLLPVGATYYVVSQPVVGTTPKAYDAKASDAFALSGTSPVFTYNAAFAGDAATGTISGGVTPVATSAQSDAVNLLQSLATPTSGTFTFIVGSGLVTVGTSTETYAFSNVPAGAYSVQAVRSTLNPDGTTTVSLSTVQSAAVTAGATTTVNLGL